MTQSTTSDYIRKIYIEKYFSEEAKDNVENTAKEFIDVYKKLVKEI